MKMAEETRVPGGERGRLLDPSPLNSGEKKGKKGKGKGKIPNAVALRSPKKSEKKKRKRREAMLRVNRLIKKRRGKRGQGIAPFFERWEVIQGEGGGEAAPSASQKSRKKGGIETDSLKSTLALAKRREKKEKRSCAAPAAKKKKKKKGEGEGGKSPRHSGKEGSAPPAQQEKKKGEFSRWVAPLEEGKSAPSNRKGKRKGISCSLYYRD